MKLKILYTLITVTLLNISCNDNIKKNDLAVHNLYEDVKLIEQNVYYTVEKFGEISKGKLFLSSEQIYNIDGNLEEVNNYYPENILGSKWVIKYNDVGNKIKTIIYNAEGDLSTEWSEKNVNSESYDYKRFNNDEIANESYHDYLKNYKYQKVSYKYDEKGKLIEIITNDPEDNLVKRETNKYDLEGNLVEVINFNSDNKINTKKISRFDDNGNVMTDEIKDYKSNETVAISYKYEFDENDNWTKRIELENGVSKYITIRKIDYY